MGDFVVSVVLVIILIFVIRSIHLQRKNSKGCHENCSSCASGSCHHDWNAIQREIKMKEQTK